VVAAPPSGGEPPRQGTILFVRGDRAFLSADGSGQTNLSGSDHAEDGAPSWVPRAA
jgi:hypothetical protein